MSAALPSGWISGALGPGLLAAGLFLVAAMAGATGYWIGSAGGGTLAPEAITAAPAERLPGGALKLERAPESAPAARELPPLPIPTGAAVERRVRVVVRPTAKPEPPSNPRQLPDCECPPVRVDLALIREGDGRRVVASSPDGEILGGLDVPVAQAMIPIRRPWVAGVSYDPFRESYGGWIERDYGRLRVGADVYTDRGAPTYRLRIGWAF